MTLVTLLILSSVLAVSCYFCFFASLSDEQSNLINKEDESQELYDSLSVGQKLFTVAAGLGALTFVLSIIAAFISWLLS